MNFSGCFVSQDFALRFDCFVLIRLRTREDKSVVFRRTRRFPSLKNEPSFGKSSAWQLLRSRFEKVFPLPIDDQQLPLQTVALGDEELQSLEADKKCTNFPCQFLFPPSRTLENSSVGDLRFCTVSH